MLYFIYAVSRSYLSIRQISPGISVVFTNPWPVLARQGYMAGKNYLSSGKNYLLKISLAYLGLYESLAFTVLSRQGYMEGKAYLSSSKNYVFVKNISGISLSLRILGLYYLDKSTWRARIICQAARIIRLSLQILALQYYLDKGTWRARIIC